MTTQVVNPGTANRSKNTIELKDRERKRAHNRPAQRRMTNKSEALTSRKPMARTGSTQRSSSKESWLEDYLVHEARENNWMLQLGEKQYRVQYSRGRDSGHSLSYRPAEERRYRAEYATDEEGQDKIQYSPCGEGRYRVEYSQNGRRQKTLNYSSCGEKQYTVEYSHKGESHNGLRYIQCGEKQYRFLCSETDPPGRRNAKGNEHGLHGLLMYDEAAKNLVILEFKDRSQLNHAKRELDKRIKKIRESSARLRKAFNLNEVRGIKGYIVQPENGIKGDTTELSGVIGRHGLIEYKKLPRKNEGTARKRGAGKDLKITFTCRKTARSLPII